MWRRPPQSSKADRDDLAGIVLLAALLAGCVPVRPACELGTYLRRVDTGSATSGAAMGSGSAISGSGRATWRGEGNSDWQCERICGANQLLKASRDERGVVSVECGPSRECPAASSPPPTSATTPATSRLAAPSPAAR